MFISFTFDPDSTIQKLKTRYNTKYKVFHLNRPECYRLNFNIGFPTSFVLNKKGIVTYSKCGGHIDVETASKDVMTIIYPKILEQL